MDKPKSNPLVFVCGVPRSGTTLLQRILDGHSQLTVANDAHFIPRALELTDKSLIDLAKRGEPIALTDQLVESARNYHRFYRLGCDAQDVDWAASQSATYQEFVSRLFDRLAVKKNKNFAGEKTPDYCRRIALLHGMFPDAKFLHLIRDGRDVALSLMQWARPDKGPGRLELWQRHPAAVSALWWQWLAMAGRQQGRPLGDDLFCEIRYEELVADTCTTVESICQFLALPFEESMLHFSREKTRTDTNTNEILSAKSAWLAPTAGLRNWRTDMSISDLELFEALASDGLQNFGYEMQHGEISAAARTTAEFCLSWWNENFSGAANRSSCVSGEKVALGGEI